MTITTLIAYLFGSRRAILQIAACRQAVWLGLLFVLSAGLAREYDGHDLLHEPWHLLVPVVASTATSFLLYCLVIAVAHRRGGIQGFYLGYYRSFLGLYWMTAPLAWMYAVPVERFLSPAAATEANLWLLAVVAAWRVALMTRVVSVLFPSRAISAFFLVMLFADTVALAIISLTPLPVFDVMGGIRLNESEQVVQVAAFLVGLLGGVSWPLWLIGTVVVASLRLPGWKPAEIAPENPTRMGRGVLLVSVLSIIVWCFMLPTTQAEQRLKRQVEIELKNHHLAEGVGILSAHRRADFPPHWDPPPRVGYGENRPPILDVLELVSKKPGAGWALDLYSEKYRDYLHHHHWDLGLLPDLDDRQLTRHLSLLESLPNGAQIIAEQERALRYLLDEQQRPKAIREHVKRLLEKVIPNGRHGDNNDDGASKRGISSTQGTERGARTGQANQG